MCKIIYSGISSDAPFLPSPFLPKFLELLGNAFDTLAAYGASVSNASGGRGRYAADRSRCPELIMSFEFFRTCLAGSQVSRVPVDKRHVSSGIHANHTTGHARLLLEFLEFKKGVPEFNLFLDGSLQGLSFS